MWMKWLTDFVLQILKVTLWRLLAGISLSMLRRRSSMTILRTGRARLIRHEEVTLYSMKHNVSNSVQTWQLG